MLRSRDIVALLLVVLLTRLAWNDSTESLTASVHLAFFFPRSKANILCPMDVDGDGTAEALAVVQYEPKSTNWILKVLDLKPLHQKQHKTHLAPFEPQVLFQTTDLLNDESGDAIPLEITSGQVLIKKPGTNSRKKQSVVIPKDTELNDRNRHFFCGIDWHDASQKCGTPCPGGTSSECENGETCFADTPCDVESAQPNPESSEVLFQLTPGGGLPSLVTLWSNGAMTLHSLTNDKDLDDIGSKRPPKTKPLELRQMWQVKLLPPSATPDDILWDEAEVLFLDAYLSEDAIAEHGMVIVSGAFYLDGDAKGSRSSFVVAVDAMKGTVLWDSFSDAEKNGDLPLPLMAERGWSSHARRRSKIVNAEASEHKGPSTELENSPNCLVSLKQHIQMVLPYSYWSPKDAKLSTFHLDLRKRHKGKYAGQNQLHNANPGHPTERMKWTHKFHKKKHSSLVFGRPNALVIYTRGGLQVRSLRNGKALCHVSMLESSVYTDLNNDGTLDQVQVLLDSSKTDPNDKFVQHLASQLLTDREEQKAKGRKQRLLNNSHSLCHALALSGFPAMEELFSTPLCGSTNERMDQHPSVSLGAVAPVVVESLSGRRNTHDVVVALSNGMVNRLHGNSGRKQWDVVGKRFENFPTWEAGSQSAIMTRVQSQNVPASIRPVLLAGENSLVIISVKNGEILSSIPYPQTSIMRPVLGEVSGDGTTDVMILSADGVWGFQISVRPGKPIVLRIMVGLLLMGLMLAVLRNRYANRKDVRATDAS